MIHVRYCHIFRIRKPLTPKRFLYLDFPTPLSPIIKIFSVVRTSLSIFQTKFWSLNQFPFYIPVDLLLNSAKPWDNSIHFVMVILLLRGHVFYICGRYVMYGKLLCPQYILCPLLYLQYPTHTYRAKQG